MTPARHRRYRYRRHYPRRSSRQARSRSMTSLLRRTDHPSSPPHRGPRQTRTSRRLVVVPIAIFGPPRVFLRFLARSDHGALVLGAFVGDDEWEEAAPSLHPDVLKALQQKDRDPAAPRTGSSADLVAVGGGNGISTPLLVVVPIAIFGPPRVFLDKDKSSRSKKKSSSKRKAGALSFDLDEGAEDESAA
jgi:hypothetical protein